MKPVLFALTAVLFVGCNQQAVEDLATCKTSLTQLQDELTTAKAATLAATEKVTALETELTQVKEQLATLQTASDEAAKTAAADAAAATKKAATTQAAAVKKAELKQAVKDADIKVTAPVQNTTVQKKAKAAGF